MLKPVTRPAESLLTAEYARFRSDRLTNVEYDLDLDLDQGAEFFSGTVTVRFDLAAFDEPVSIDFSDGQVDAVVVNGKAVDPDYNGSFLTLPAFALREGHNEARIEFRHAYSRSGQGLHRFVDTEDSRVYLHSHFEPYDANRLFPCFDQPDLKASYALQVTAPSSWQVVSAGANPTVIEDGTRKRWSFPRVGPISTYIFPLHAGEYRVWESEADGIPLRLFARHSLAPYVQPEEWFSLTQQGFEFFQAWFDMPYPYGKYDQLIVPEFNIGGMENVAAVTYSEKFVRRGEYTRENREQLANVLLHEMSHMWFGDLVTPAWWDGLWLKEAFATYMAFLAQAKATEFGDAWHMFYAQSKQRAYEADQMVTTHPIEVPVDDTHNAFVNFDRITYQKGASVLTQLSHYVGRDAFRQGVRAYLKTHAGGATRLPDFIAALETASGRDLAHWVTEWLQRAGLNLLQVEMRCQDGQIEQLHLRQTAPKDYPTLRTHRLQLGLYRMDEATGEFESSVVPLLARGEITEVTTARGSGCPHMAYPNHDDWAFIKVRLDPATRDALRKDLPRVPDPLLRSMFLQSFWDMARDADLSLFEYVDLALELASTETSGRILIQLAATIEEAMAYLWRLPADTEPARSAALDRIEAFVAERVRIADPGSDLEKLWVDTFLRVAHGPAAAEEIAAWLLAERATRVSLDQDRRWSAVIALNAIGDARGDELRHQELEADPSDNGRRQAMAADAARPLGESKRAWLQQILDPDSELSLARRRAVIGALFPASQYGLQETLAADIIASLPVVGKQHEDAFLLSYGTLIPRLCRPESVARLEQAIEEYQDINPVLLRALRVAHQEDARCLAMAARSLPTS